MEKTITGVYIDVEKLSKHVPQMKARDEATAELYNTMENYRSKGSGMDSIPPEIFNALVSHLLAEDRLRDAMMIVCAANWGMRFSDLSRVRFCHIFDRSGNFLDKFSLPNGEKKTQKANIYFNNEATRLMIRRYIAEDPRITPMDFLFTSNSGNAPETSYLEIEAEEKYGKVIKKLKKQNILLEKERKSLIKLYTENLIDSGTFKTASEEIEARAEHIRGEISRTEENKRKFLSENPDKAKIKIQAPLSRTAAENIIKSALAEINVLPKNRTDKGTAATTEEKYNTHSLRKTFSAQFLETGARLRDAGKIDLDRDLMQLLQDKLMHSSMQITDRYNKYQLEIFGTICRNMNIGLEAILSE